MLIRLVDLLAPPQCGGCRRVGAWLCAGCHERITRAREPTCGRCGAEVESVRDRCGCRTRLRSLNRLRSAALYEGPIEIAVQRLKYDGWRRLAAPLADLVAERLVAEGVAAGWAVAVPLHRGREQARGFNQSELLARSLRSRLQLRAPPGRLRRIRATPQQVGHDRMWRARNVEGAFEWQGADLGRRAILLIDDVATTGATLDACAAALKAGGSGPVIGATVARVAL